jgi:uncharacterized protein (DUF433 family)
MQIIHRIDMIVSDPAVRSGRPMVAGTSIRVSDLVASHLYRGLTPEELAVNFALNLAQVYAALAYYYMHKTEVDTEIRANAVEAERLLSEFAQQGKLMQFE